MARTLITLFTRNCQVEMLFSSDIIIEMNHFYCSCSHSKHDKHRLRAASHFFTAAEFFRFVKFTENMGLPAI